tara:strand:- start:711 stop:848 length:138 start_codon:yes stop_codon:yes gene_type:complete
MITECPWCERPILPNEYSVESSGELMHFECAFEVRDELGIDQEEK